MRDLTTRYLGHEVEPSDAATAVTVSPDGRWFTVTNVENRTDGFFSPFSYGRVLVDIYRAATGEKMVSLRGSHRGPSVSGWMISGSWVSDRFYVLPASLDESALLLCDLGTGEAATYDIDPEQPEFWGIGESGGTPEMPYPVNQQTAFVVAIRTRGEGYEAEWRMKNHAGRNAIVKAGHYGDPAMTGLLFMGAQMPYRDLGPGPYVIDQMVLLLGSRRVPISTPQFTTPAYSFLMHPVDYVFPPRPPTRPVSVVPFVSTAAAQDYRFILEDPFQGVAAHELKVLLNFDQSLQDACAFTFDIPDRKVVLMDDRGTGVAGKFDMGAQGTAQNSRCTVSKPEMRREGRLLSLSLRVDPTSAFNGRRNVYVKIDGYVGQDYPWNWRATWRVDAAAH